MSRTRNVHTIVREEFEVGRDERDAGEIREMSAGLL